MLYSFEDFEDFSDFKDFKDFKDFENFKDFKDFEDFEEFKEFNIIFLRAWPHVLHGPRNYTNIKNYIPNYFIVFRLTMMMMSWKEENTISRSRYFDLKTKGIRSRL